MMSDTHVNGVTPKKKKKKPTFSPLEIDADEELSSLVQETGDFSHVVSKLTLRKPKSSVFDASNHNHHSSYAAARVLGLLRNAGISSFAVRNALFLCLLGGMVFLFLHTMDDTVNIIEDNVQHSSKYKQNHPHSSSFGGTQNIAHVGGATLHDKHSTDKLHDLTLPKSNVKGAVVSLQKANVINHVGHYWHDPYNSPFASFLLEKNRNASIEEAEKKEYETKMHHVAQQWGAWNFTDTASERPKVQWDKYPYRDAPLSEFPNTSWQTSPAYIQQFLAEAQSLITRVLEGIYMEYGHGTTDDMTPVEIKKRDALFGVRIERISDINGATVSNNQQDSGVAYMHSQASWNGLVTKLLHGIVTHDWFHVVWTGNDKATAGHGNNFVQSQAMQFHHLMEPVFDLLGMQLMTRNMAMVASTLTSALAGASIYGEADVMLYNEGTAVDHDDNGPSDLFNRQAILAGERVPVLFTDRAEAIMRESKGKAWVGSLESDANVCGEMKDAQGTDVPWACRGMKCPSKNKSWCAPQYDSVCWLDRTDYTPTKTQKDHVDNNGGAFPDPIHHQWEARKLSLVILHAMRAALDKFQEGIDKDGVPLNEEYWHVGDKYKGLKNTVKAEPPADANKGPCETFFKEFPAVCRTPMRGVTEWTPRRVPTNSSLRSLVRPDVSIWTRDTSVPYDDMDLLSPSWKIPSNEVDVHAIAISTTAPKPETNDFGEYTDDNTDFLDGDDEYYFDDFLHVGDDFYLRQLEEEDNDVSSSRQDNGERSKPFLRRTAVEEAKTADSIVPGYGWILFNTARGFCDGSPQSICRRTPDSDCLMAGHNDGKGGLLGDAQSGWLILTIPRVHRGLILARFETKVPMKDIPKLQDGWSATTIKGDSGAHDDKEDDKGEGHVHGGHERQLYIPSDFTFDYAINGKITSLTGREFANMGVSLVDGLTVWPLLNDSDGHASIIGKKIELAIRIRSKSKQGANLLLSHLYFA